MASDRGGTRRDGAAAAILGVRRAGGQALARYVADNPALVAGRRVLDFASGSGLVAIAAAKAGARRVEASDIDAFALAAVALNAEANAVEIVATTDDLIGRDDGWTWRSPGTSPTSATWPRPCSTGWRRWPGAAPKCASATPGAPISRATGWSSSPNIRVPVTRELEDSEIKRTGVYRFKPC